MRNPDKGKLLASVVILAAGRSSRMGRPKLALSFDEERSFLGKIVAEYVGYGCRQIVLVTNRRDEAQARSLLQGLTAVDLVVNEHPDRERMHSLQLGLGRIHGSEPVFLQPVDNPLVDRDVLGSLDAGLGSADFAVPTYRDKGGHPILIGGRICARIAELTGYTMRLDEFLQAYDRRSVPVNDAGIHANINSPEDYARLVTGRKEKGK